MFNCDLELSPDTTEQTFRMAHNRQTGQEGLVFHEYQKYEQISLQFNEETKPLDDSVLQNASIQGAVRSGWLQVIKGV